MPRARHADRTTCDTRSREPRNQNCKTDNTAVRAHPVRSAHRLLMRLCAARAYRDARAHDSSDTLAAVRKALSRAAAQPPARRAQMPCATPSGLTSGQCCCCCCCCIYRHASLFPVHVRDICKTTHDAGPCAGASRKMFQTNTDSSSPTETSCLPSGENCMERTAPEWYWALLSTVPVA